ncbi:thioredoxin (plasmid) [Pseudomonas sp. FeN3W]|nr:thioredoxin [Pseudomonas sp. FeN3W]
MSERIIEATTEKFTDLLSGTKMPILVDFWAEWCGPCKMIAPLLEALAHDRDDILIVKVNVDESPELATRYGVRGIPTLILMQDEEIKATKVGALSRAQLDAFLAQSL